MILRLHSVLTGCLTLLLAALLAFAPVGARPASGHQADRAGGHLIPAVASRAVPGTRALQGLDTPGRTFLVTETMGVLQLGIGELGAGQGRWEGARLTVGAYGGRFVLREGERLVSVMSDEFKALNKVVGETAEGFAIVRRDNGSLGVLKADGAIVATNGGVVPTRALTAAEQRKAHHILEQDKHQLNPMIERFGSREQAYVELDSAAQRAYQSGNLNINANGINVGQARISVGGIEVDLVGGRVIDGRFILGSASRRDIP